ncbi:MAG: cation diffusion facilitator family transporter [Vicinamibacterales bacterium]
MAHAHDADREPLATLGRTFAVGIVLNVGFVILEALYGWRAGSLALLADAFHNLSDVGGLLLAWAGLAAGRLAPNERHTYGWRRGSILASFGNAVLLLVAMGSLAWEAAHRLQSPAAIDGATVVVVAAIGVVINATTAGLFFHGRKGDLNIRAAFLHMAADALVSLGVVGAGVVYLWRGWVWIDPVVSLVIAAVVVAGTWSLFKESLHLLFDGVPEGIDVRDVRATLLALPGVQDLHELHVWGMATSETALTAHLVLEAQHGDRDSLLRAATHALDERFKIRHVTLQLESAGCPSDRHC